jgi:hypothetical protein
MKNTVISIGWLPEESVTCEPCSATKFPITGKLTGNLGSICNSLVAARLFLAMDMTIFLNAGVLSASGAVLGRVLSRKSVELESFWRAHLDRLAPQCIELTGILRASWVAAEAV